MKILNNGFQLCILEHSFPNCFGFRSVFTFYISCKMFFFFYFHRDLRTGKAGKGRKPGNMKKRKREKKREKMKRFVILSLNCASYIYTLMSCWSFQI